MARMEELNRFQAAEDAKRLEMERRREERERAEAEAKAQAQKMLERGKELKTPADLRKALE